MRLYLKRRLLFLLFGLFITGTLFYMTYMLNSIGREDLNLSVDEAHVNLLDKKLNQLEVKASENQKNLQELEKVYKNLFNLTIDKGKENHPKHVDMDINPIQEPIINQHQNKQNLIPNSNLVNVPPKVYQKQCDWFNEQKPKSSDIEVSDLIESLSFEDVDGGVWKQGFDITYDPIQWRDQKLNIIVIPHSHNDPGWIMTFEEYFQQRTRNILDTIVNSLSEVETRKFVWAETSYLSLWWNQASEDMKSKFKRLVLQTKQLEIVTGGWVMTDEANSHYYATIEQMIEGHEWLKANIDPSIRPTYGWSIDPFGYTPTMAYLLNKMGFDAMLIQRVHYHLKKYMAKTQRFEFMWRQGWSTVNSKDTSILCHVMPFYSYDIPHTCGPDPKVCCQFDFKRLDGRISCPWGAPPQKIDNNNIDERAKLLLDQYRKKSQLYGDKHKHNVLLVSLGDDFRYQDMEEAHLQFENYQRLMDYMNSREEWRVNIKFGTLKDYFELLNKNIKENDIKMETFSGDFFTYADRQDHYWSGYFTSRAFYKRLDRLVEHYLRTAEIVFSLGNLLQPQLKNKLTQANSLYKELLEARRNLALFQHHDGITGTSKSYVVLDYANKLYVSLKNCKNIIEQSASYLMTETNVNENIFTIDDVRLINTKEKTNDLTKSFIHLSDTKPSKKIVLFNTNLNKRNEIVSFRVNTPHVDVLLGDNTPVKNVQVGLVWPNTDGGYLSEKLTDRVAGQDDLSFGLDFDTTYYELLFEANLDPLSMNTFTIRKKSDSDPYVDRMPKVTFYSPRVNKQILSGYEEKIKQKLGNLTNKIKYNEIGQDGELIEIKLGNDRAAHFSPRFGFLNKIVSGSNTIKTKVKLIKYGTTNAREKSGAYLFLPDGPGQHIDTSQMQWIRMEHDGMLRARVCVNFTIVLHCVEFYPTLDNLNNFKIPFLSAWNVVDLRQSHNYELAMHIETDIKNDDFIYTDLNGFQYIKRKRYEKLTLQGNVYPMPSGAFIQDTKYRFNLLTAQPLGVASLDPSSIQVFLDRRLDQDDNRGMEQSMNDNVVVSNRFIMFYESINSDYFASPAYNHPSLAANLASFDLLNPIVKLILDSNSASILAQKKFSNSNLNYPCDLRLVNMRTMQTPNEEPMPNHVGLILHRVSYEDCSNKVVIPTSYLNKNCKNSELNKLKFDDFFKFVNENSSQNRLANITNTYLTLSYKTNKESSNVKNDDAIFDYVQPMQIEAFRINFN